MKETNKVAKAFILILQIGLTMIVSIALCGLVGYFIDSRFGTSLMVFFIAFGVICGYSGVYSLIRQFIDMSSSKEKYEQMFGDWEDEETDASKPEESPDGVWDEGDDDDES